MIERILLVGDIFRPGPENQPDWQNQLVSRFADCLLPIMGAASGLPTSSIQTGARGDISQSALYAALGRPFDHQTWIALYTGSIELNDTVAELLRPLVRSALIVGFELPRALTEWLAKEGVPVVDIAVGPLQFLEDITLCMRATDADVGARLSKYELDAPTITAMAGIARSTLRSEPLPPEAELEDVALICTSSPKDRLMILGDRYATFADFRDQVTDICATHTTVLVKSHPWGGITPEDRDLFAQFPNCRPTTTNIYALLSLVPGLKTVVSLCSAVSLEAPWFGVDGVNLLTVPMDLARDQADDQAAGRFVTVLHDFWSASFWAYVLEPICERRAHLPRDMVAMPHRLRNVLNMHGPTTPVFQGPIKRGQSLHGVDAKASETFGKLAIGNVSGPAPLSIDAQYGVLADWYNGEAPPDQRLTRLYNDNNGITLFQTLDDRHQFGQNVFGWTRDGARLDGVVTFGDFRPSDSGVFSSGSRQNYWHNTFTHVVTLGVFTVATLPNGAAGATAYCSDGRVGEQGPGQGTGTQVVHNGTDWCVTGSDRPVKA